MFDFLHSIHFVADGFILVLVICTFDLFDDGELGVDFGFHQVGFAKVP